MFPPEPQAPIPSKGNDAAASKNAFVPEHEIRRYGSLFRQRVNLESLPSLVTDMLKSEVGASVRVRGD